MSTPDPHDVPPLAPGGDPFHQQRGGYSAPSQPGYAQQHAQQAGYGAQQQHQGGYAAPVGYAYDPNGYAQHGGVLTNPYDPRRVGTQPGVSVGPVDAVKRFFAKYAQFSGRASRSEYWWSALFLFVVSMLLYVLAFAAGPDRYGNLSDFAGLMLVLLFLFFLGTVIPSIAVSVRRLHDIDMSGFVFLVSFIPFIGGLILLIFMVLPPKPQGARFDR